MSNLMSKKLASWILLISVRKGDLAPQLLLVHLVDGRLYRVNYGFVICADLSPEAEITVNSLSLLNLMIVKTVAANTETGNTLMSILGIARAINSITVAVECQCLAKLSNNSNDTLVQ